MRSERPVTIIIAVVVTLAIIGVLLARPDRRPDGRDHAASRPAVTPITTPDLDALLPLTKPQLAAAVKAATDFATAYATHHDGQGSASYLARLKPMATPELHEALTRAVAASGGIGTSRTRGREITTPRVVPVKLRTIGPGSMIVIVDLHYEPDTTTDTGGGYSEQFAITAVTTTRDHWVISDLQLASAGNQGEIPGAAPS
jgi:hypothetical protein